MNSCVFINLDTEAPNLDIYVPSYTTREVQVEVNIHSDDELDDWQEVYVIDSNGTRYDYTFEINGNQMTGILNFNSFPLGVSTLFVKVRDVVMNVSNLFSKTITIRNSLSLLVLDMSDSIRELTVDDKDRDLTINDKTKTTEMEVSDKDRNIDVDDKGREIEIKDEVRKEVIDNDNS